MISPNTTPYTGTEIQDLSLQGYVDRDASA